MTDRIVPSAFPSVSLKANGDVAVGPVFVEPTGGSRHQATIVVACAGRTSLPDLIDSADRFSAVRDESGSTELKFYHGATVTEAHAQTRLVPA